MMRLERDLTDLDSLDLIARYFVTWQQPCHFAPEARAVIQFAQMSKLVRDHVIDNRHRKVHQAPAKPDAAVV